MPRAKQPTKRPPGRPPKQTIDVEPPEEGGTAPKPGPTPIGAARGPKGQFQPGHSGRKPAAGVTRDALKTMIESVNWGLTLTQRQEYLLHPVEIQQLTDCWYAVIEQYPSFGRYIAAGNKLTVWGQALFTTYAIVNRRLQYAPAQATYQAGPAHSDNGHERHGEDDVSPAADVYSDVSRDFGLET